MGETTPATPFRIPTPRRNQYGPKKCAAFGTPPEPRTVPTYDLDGIAVRIPVSSIPDQGPVLLSLALDELVEVLGECLDLCCSGWRRKFIDGLVHKICVVTDDLASATPVFI